MTAPPVPPLGEQLRAWRQRRRVSQLALAYQADVSQRHLSFVESGRARPSREMVLHLAEQLGVPLRERNRMLLAAGYAPAFPERPLDDPELAAAREAVELVLAGHAPYPALAVDRHWTLVAANAAVHALMGGVAPALLEPPANVLRASLHPDGLAPRIANLREWRAHLLARLRRQHEATADPVLAALHDELAGYPLPDEARRHPAPPDVGSGGIVVPLRLTTPLGDLSFISTTTVFGTALDVTVAEVALECFYPADATTAERLRAIAAA